MQPRRCCRAACTFVWWSVHSAWDGNEIIEHVNHVFCTSFIVVFLQNIVHVLFGFACPKSLRFVLGTK